ncbi:MAG: hypothetical protein M0Q12_00190 [Synergistaceae bacterium]|jgi:hypothetical protein|nr:hypothetical protein [Synergistaceae bacterium]
MEPLEEKKARLRRQLRALFASNGEMDSDLYEKMGRKLQLEICNVERQIRDEKAKRWADFIERKIEGSVDIANDGFWNIRED